MNFGSYEHGSGDKAEKETVMRIEFKLVIIIHIVLLLACENPFGDEKISGGQKTIAGRVMLQDGLPPEGVFIYLETADIYTRTDAAGEFGLRLPTTAETNKLQGVYRLIAFMGGYHIGEAEIAIENGRVVYSQEALDGNGRLKNDLELKRSLYVSTIVDPSLHTSHVTGGDTVRTTLKAAKDTVGVLVPEGTVYRLGGVLLKERESGELTPLLFSSDSASATAWLTVEEASRVISCVIDTVNYTLEAGAFKVIPWILPYHHPLMPLVYSRLQVNTDHLDESFLNIPFHRLDADFSVRAKLPD